MGVSFDLLVVVICVRCGGVMVIGLINCEDVLLVGFCDEVIVFKVEFECSVVVIKFFIMLLGVFVWIVGEWL